MKKNGEHFVTCGQMRVLEKRADEDGLSYYRMMENAGSGAAAEILERMEYKRVMASGTPEDSQADRKVAEAVTVGNAAESPNDDNKEPKPVKTFVFCGKGNNGGDGFVVARLLCEAGHDITVILVDGYPKTRDSITNFELLKKLPIRVIDMSESKGALMELKGKPDIIVDAIYGTGFHGKLRSNGLQAAIYINRFSKGEPGFDKTTVFALDIPSGLSGDLMDERELERSSIVAHCTITFHAKKPVHLHKFTEAYCGNIVVVDIGIDEERLWNVEI